MSQDAGRTPRDAYRDRAEVHEAEATRLERESRRLGTVRFIAFFAALAPWVASELWAGVPGAVGWASLPLALVFGALVNRHRRLRGRLRRAQVAAALARHGVARLDRDWDALPTPVEAAAGPEHAWAGDLDLYGRASLRSLLGPVHTPPGHAELDRWLLTSCDPATARSRQAAVRLLAARTELRERAAVEGALLDPVESGALARFLRWCQAPPVVPATVMPLAWGLPALTLALAVGDAVGWAPDWSWVAPLAVQAAVSWWWGRRLHESFVGVSSGVAGIRRYHRLFAVWEQAPMDADLVRDAVGALRGPGASASTALRRLERWLQAADARWSSLHPVLAVVFLWDLHVGRGLDRWRTEVGTRVDGWMSAVGRLEASAAVATLAADHPGWSWPTVEEPGPAPLLRAEGLGHPLLRDDVCVRNDVTVGPPGRVLLITGSNMSGKSTLLRSLGLAVVLAGAGGPVCARALRLPACRLFTSMRVQDSLAAGVSFFMAELERLVALLREAPPTGTHDGDPPPPLFYLVDEILQGTNSQERRIAGRRLVRHLLRRRALGAVTTHDLEFHRHPELEEAAELVHFRESVRGEGPGATLTFDYRLRPGLATTRNALLLAERVGLTEPGEPGEEAPGGSQRITR